MVLTWSFYFLSLAYAFQGGVYQNGNEWSVRESSSDIPLAYGSFLDNIESTGWSILNIFTNDAANAPDASKWYAAGYFEGITTCERIGQYYINFYWEIFGQDPVPEKIVDYMQQTDNYTVTMAALNAASDPYWNAVNLTMSRMNGLIDGYAASTCAASQPLSRLEFWLVSSDGDLFDLTEALNELPSNRVRRGRSSHRGIMSHHLSQVNSEGQTEIMNKIEIDGLNVNTTGRKVPRCSVLIKLTENNDDLIFAHATWDDFTSLGPRVYKNFNFTVQGERYIDSFSSCAGFIASVDDWYVLNSGLVVTETSYSCYNRSLFNYLSPNSLLSWIRTMVANRLATTGKEWVYYFSRENSGTYNNQWMVIDTKLFKSGRPIQPNTLWIVEQMPGNCISGDVSDILQKQGYWASYNIPFFPQVYRETGYLAAYELLGNEYSFTQCPRAQIFARNQSNVQSLEDMKKMIQYNKWQTDPLSEGKGSNAVASRYDLDPVPEAAGALDSKVSSASILKDSSLTQHIICGPTHDDQPVFCWEGAFDAVVPHKGQPRCYNFTWEILTPQYLPPPSSM